MPTCNVVVFMSEYVLIFESTLVSCQADAAMGEIVQPIFITVDPKRDTGAVLAEYRKRYHSRLLALTGPLERLTAVAKLFRIYISSIPDGVDDYLVDHSICLYLMDTNGKILEYFGQVLRVF